MILPTVEGIRGNTEPGQPPSSNSRRGPAEYWPILATLPPPSPAFISAHTISLLPLTGAVAAGQLLDFHDRQIVISAAFQASARPLSFTSMGLHELHFSARLHRL